MKLLGCLFTLMIVGHTLSSELKILNLPFGDPGSAKCTLTCSGVSRYNEPVPDYKWKATARFNDNQRNIYIKSVDMQGCRFLNVPVVTVSVHGGFHCPPIMVKNVSKEYILVSAVEDGGTPDNLMVTEKCDVFWIATSYVDSKLCRNS